ncbi:hypothetical protein [Streptomyces sp. NPDC048277]|uniref:hypothetical protein n=1 Tax=Streptomyces sp. NPDC048277 TaxID=3155027 RepID=UPI00340EC0D7
MPPDQALGSSYGQGDVPDASSQQVDRIPTFSDHGFSELTTVDPQTDFSAQNAQAQYAAMQPGSASGASYPPVQPDHAHGSSYGQGDVPVASSQLADRVPSINEAGLREYWAGQRQPDHAHGSSYGQGDVSVASSQPANRIPSINEAGLREYWAGQRQPDHAPARYAAMQPGGASGASYPPVQPDHAHGSSYSQRSGQHGGRQGPRR